MKIKDFLASLFVVIPLFFVACNEENIGSSTTPDLPTKPIVILFENDVHCSVDGYPVLVAIRNECQTSTSHVATVSCGDLQAVALSVQYRKASRL